MIKILIADDHPIVRQGLRQTIAETEGMEVSAQAQDCHEVLELMSKRKFDVVLLDLSMPGRGGMDVLKQIRAVKNKIPILILSTYSEDQYALRAMKSGASGYLTKNSDPEILIEAIRKVASGGKYISSTLAEKMAFDIDVDFSKPLHEALSEREYEVLIKIASGKKVSEIGEELSLSVKTVSTYRERILGKMRLKNNSELTHYCFKNKLID